MPFQRHSLLLSDLAALPLPLTARGRYLMFPSPVMRLSVVLD